MEPERPRDPEEDRRRRLQARQIALSGLGYLSSFAILLIARAGGAAVFSNSDLGGALAFVSGGLTALYLLARSGLHRVLAPWDPHWVYTPLLFTGVALHVLMNLAPGLRWVLLHGWLAAVGMSAGYIRLAPGALLTLAVVSVYLTWATRLPGTTPLMEVPPVLSVLVSSAVLAVVSERLRSQRREVRMLAERLRVANQRLAELAVRDPLTNAFNRRYLEEQLALDVERSRRSGQPLVVAIMDLDGFKRYNDIYGHLAGDEVLRGTVERVRTCVRTGDVVARYGGDEFVVVLVGAHRRDGAAVLERIRGAVASVAVRGGQGVKVVTASVGAACYPDHGSTSEELLRRADAALYRAKKEGGNRVVFAEEACREGGVREAVGTGWNPGGEAPRPCSAPPG